MAVKVKHTEADLQAAAGILADGLAAMAIEVSAVRQRLLIDYLQLLCKWNRSYNLTAVRDLRQMVTRHLLDSLSLSPLLAGDRLIDVGSGAGLPGLVLALTQPKRRFVLLDSALKRSRFLIQSVHELQLANVRVVRARVEDFKPAQRFDCMISRASLGLDALIAVADRLLASNGVMLSMQGKRPEQTNFHTQRGVIFKQLKVPGLDAQRHVAIYHPA